MAKKKLKDVSSPCGCLLQLVEDLMQGDVAQYQSDLNACFTVIPANTNYWMCQGALGAALPGNGNTYNAQYIMTSNQYCIATSCA